MKLITTYKEHKEKPDEQVQGLGRALAYGGLDYIFNLLKNDEIYSEELEDGIIGIEAYVNEREKEIERLNKENEKLKNGLNKLLQLNNYMVNFSSKKVIGKLIVKQWDLIYELLEGRPRGIMHGSKGVDKK